MTMHVFLAVACVICFALSTVGAKVPYVNLQSLGLTLGAIAAFFV